jgi:nitrous oxidase accessory protein NosD
MRVLPRPALAVAVAAATACAAAVSAVTPAAADSAARHTVYVATDGSSGNAGSGCGSATYSSIAAAVHDVATGGVVVVCSGTYAEDVVVGRAMTLRGQGATIDATGLENGIQVVASHVVVRGFRIMNANGEAVLVGVDTAADAGLLPPSSPVLRDVVVTHVAALHDDRGFNGTENGNCKYPGDCGGGIHLNAVVHSWVTDSRVVGNADGILLTDDYGPTAHNVVAGNWVTDNTTECGIVLAAHNPGAVSFDPATMLATGRNRTVAGLYDNRILDNVSLRNGTAPAPAQFGGLGSGAGVGIFGSGPGTGAYDNVVAGNVMAGNGLAGFTIHAHLPGGEDVNGNVVSDNRVLRNNVGGDPFDGPSGPMDLVTTGIAVYSAVPVHMVIRENRIAHDRIGIWLSTTVHAQGLGSNRFHDVGRDIVRG